MEDPDGYFEMISCIIATPYDLMVMLDDMGIDFTKINDFELFCLLFTKLQQSDTRLVFGDLDLSKFKTAISEQNNELVLRDEENDITIDKAIHHQIQQAICKFLMIEKKPKTPANEDARKFMIERARKKLKRQLREKKGNEPSSIESVVIGLVNTEQFPYNYKTVLGITVYQLYASLGQISHKINYENLMSGYYAGTIKYEDIKQEDRSWLKM